MGFEWVAMDTGFHGYYPLLWAVAAAPDPFWYLNNVERLRPTESPLCPPPVLSLGSQHHSPVYGHTEPLDVVYGPEECSDLVTWPLDGI